MLQFARLGPRGLGGSLSRAGHRRVLASTAPPQLGALNGPCIRNKKTILHDVDRALHPDAPRPPDVEVLVTEHLAYTGNPVSRFLHHHLIALGHVLVRYTTSDGEQHVMNILGGDALKRGGRMVNFAKPEEYLYGTEGYDGWNQQAGVYNRNIVGVRIEHAPEGVVDALHAYYKALDMRSEIREDEGEKPLSSALLDPTFRPHSASRLARFELFGGRVSNFVAGHLPPVVGSLLNLTRERLMGAGAGRGRLDFSLVKEERLLSAAGNCTQVRAAR
jgi:hypothetical protein